MWNHLILQSLTFISVNKTPVASSSDLFSSSTFTFMQWFYFNLRRTQQATQWGVSFVFFCVSIASLSLYVCIVGLSISSFLSLSLFFLSVSLHIPSSILLLSLYLSSQGCFTDPSLCGSVGLHNFFLTILVWLSRWGRGTPAFPTHALSLYFLVSFTPHFFLSLSLLGV